MVTNLKHQLTQRDNGKRVHGSLWKDRMDTLFQASIGLSEKGLKTAGELSSEVTMDNPNKSDHEESTAKELRYQ